MTKWSLHSIQISRILKFLDAYSKKKATWGADVEVGSRNAEVGKVAQPDPVFKKDEAGRRKSGDVRE